MGSRKRPSSSLSSDGDANASSRNFIPCHKIEPIHQQLILSSSRAEVNQLGRRGVWNEDNDREARLAERVKIRNKTRHDNMEDNAALYTFVEVSDNDVLCGREKQCYHHSGNQRFRSLIRSCLEPFRKCTTRAEKGIVVKFIKDSVSLKGGRFLKQDSESRSWHLAEEKANEKIKHALRDLLSCQIKESQHLIQTERHDADGEQQPFSRDNDALRLHETSSLSLFSVSSSGSSLSESAIDDYNEISMASLMLDQSNTNAVDQSEAEFARDES
jgi:hypothetical protein